MTRCGTHPALPISPVTPGGRHIDFKDALPGRKDSDKRDFFADVAAFTNSAGGDIVFGIEEERDGANKPTGIAKALIRP